MTEKRTLRLWALIAIQLVVAINFGVELYLIERLGSTVWKDAVRASDNIVVSLKDNIKTTLDNVEAVVSVAQNAMETQDVAALDPQIRDQLLFARATNVTQVQSVVILSAAGKVVYGTPPAGLADVAFADQAFFTSQLPLGAPTTLTVWTGGLRPHDARLVMSRRITGSDGAFGGAVVAFMPPNVFRPLFAPVDIGPRGAVLLVHEDGRMVNRQARPGGQSDFGRDMKASPVFQRMMTNPTVAFSAEATVDGVKRYYVHRPIPGFPLVVSVAFAEGDVLAEWTQQGVILMVLGATLCLTIVALVLSVHRSMESRGRIQEELEGLIQTDRVTGLPNRRHFDDLLQKEWRKAARDDEPLSVLIISLEHFGSVTSTIGRAAADTMLRSVASDIQAALKRPADLVARFGQDEFAVLLPNTNRHGAAAVAQRLQAAVERAPARSTPGGPATPVTARVGSVTSIVAPGADVADIVRAVDRARAMARDTARPRVLSEERFSQKAANDQGR